MSKQCFTLYSKSLVIVGFAFVVISAPAHSTVLPERGGKKFFELSNARAGKPGGVKIASTDSFMPLRGYAKAPPSSVRKLASEKQDKAKEKISTMETQALRDEAEDHPKINREALEILFPELKQDRAESKEDAPFVWPMEASIRQRISSFFGFRKDPFTGKRAFHKGIDIAAPVGTKVLAAADGVVTEVSTHKRLGRYVKVEHGAEGYTLYGHLATTEVRKGKKVKAGDALGKVGSSGRSTGPHLDFSYRQDGEAVNPLPLLAVPSYIKTLELSDARK